MNSNVGSLDAIRERVLGGPAPVLVDVRTPAEFVRLHAPSARSLPLAKITPAAVEPLRDPDGRIYLTCQAGTRAATACRQLEAAGVRDLCLVEGGMVAWVAAGLPTVSTGKGVISLERQVRMAAGFLVVLGCLLSWLVQPALLLISVFVGAGLIFSGITGFCGMGVLLSKMPWNTHGAAPSVCRAASR